MSLTKGTKLLTPDDLIIQEHIARKHRWALSTRQLQRRQLQVLDQLIKFKVDL